MQTEFQGPPQVIDKYGLSTRLMNSINTKHIHGLKKGTITDNNCPCKEREDNKCCLHYKVIFQTKHITVAHAKGG